MSPQSIMSNQRRQLVRFAGERASFRSVAAQTQISRRGRDTPSSLCRTRQGSFSSPQLRSTHTGDTGQSGNPASPSRSSPMVHAGSSGRSSSSPQQQMASQGAASKDDAMKQSFSLMCAGHLQSLGAETLSESSTTATTEASDFEQGGSQGSTTPAESPAPCSPMAAWRRGSSPLQGAGSAVVDSPQDARSKDAELPVSTDTAAPASRPSSASASLKSDGDPPAAASRRGTSLWKSARSRTFQALGGLGGTDTGDRRTSIDGRRTSMDFGRRTSIGGRRGSIRGDSKRGASAFAGLTPVQRFRLHLVIKYGCLREAFKALDSTGKGRMSYRAFEERLNEHGIDMAEVTGLEHLTPIFKELDVNGTGSITVSELIGDTAEPPPDDSVDWLYLTTEESWNRYCDRTSNVDGSQCRLPAWQSKPLSAVSAINELERKKTRDLHRMRTALSQGVHKTEGGLHLAAPHLPSQMDSDTVQRQRREAFETMDRRTKRIRQALQESARSRHELSGCVQALRGIEEEERRKEARELFIQNARRDASGKRRSLQAGDVFSLDKLNFLSM